MTGPVVPEGDIAGLERVVFVRDRQIFSSRAKGRYLVPLTDPGDYFAPVWSPDGTRVAFLKQEGIPPNLSNFVGIVSADGQGERNLFEGRIMLGSLSWSPDGRSLAFMVTDRLRSRRQVVLLDVETGNWRAVPGDTTEVRWFSDVSWAPRERRVFYSELIGLQWDIFSVDAEGKGVLQITDHPQNEVFPSVSPDGSQVAFFSDRTGEWRIYIQGVAGGEARMLTDLSSVGHRVCWSPEGTHIAFVGGGNIYTIGTDGTEERQVTTIRSAYLLHSWSPDGKYLAFRANLSRGVSAVDTYELYALNLETGDLEQILDVAADVDVLWARR